MNKKKMKRYGFDRTALRLSDNAERAYNIIDPLNIWEYSVNGMNLYDVTGADEAYALSERQLNEHLETLYDEIMADVTDR